MKMAIMTESGMGQDTKKLGSCAHDDALTMTHCRTANGKPEIDGIEYAARMEVPSPYGGIEQ
jgi:hypothetical protein